MDHLHESMFTALIDDKVDFVVLFLNEGLKLKNFLTVDILCSLYAGVSYSKTLHYFLYYQFLSPL